MIPLDDLLPTSDDSYSPPTSGEFFDTGAPFWEFADFAKWGKNSADWQKGYRAALFECALKSGKRFLFRAVDSDEAVAYSKRAASYRRVSDVTTVGLSGACWLSVSQHEE